MECSIVLTPQLWCRFQHENKARVSIAEQVVEFVFVFLTVTVWSSITAVESAETRIRPGQYRRAIRAVPCHRLKRAEFRGTRV
jgi:hypothetical protein